VRGAIDAGMTMPEWQQSVRGSIHYRNPLDDQAGAPRTNKESRQ
jgi:hypothetical protein